MRSLHTYIATAGDRKDNLLICDIMLCKYDPSDIGLYSSRHTNVSTWFMKKQGGFNAKSLKIDYIIVCPYHLTNFFTSIICTKTHFNVRRYGAQYLIAYMT